VTGLRAARTAAGWSQSEAATRLVELARGRGTTVAGPASLKTQLSRWENGHALPEPAYRDLLSELYGRTTAELGLTTDDPHDPAAHGPARLRTALAEAAAVGRAGAALWRDQLAAATRLDAELGAAGAAAVVDAQIERLGETVRHVLEPAARGELTAVLAAAAALGAAQSLDQGHHHRAWLRYDQARSAAREVGLPIAAAEALAGQAEVLVDIGEAAAAVALLRPAEPGGPPVAPAGAPDDTIATIRLSAAAALATAAAGDRDGAHAAMAEARRRWRAGPIDIVRPFDGPTVGLADLDRWHGHALVDLGDGAAVEALDRALAAHRPTARERAQTHAALQPGPPDAVVQDAAARELAAQRPTIRQRAQIHADLALALRSERPDAAAEHAAAARELAASIGSERVVARLVAGARTTRPPDPQLSEAR
jgi:transcriptional regulator with XRE-family HTH domain